MNRVSPYSGKGALVGRRCTDSHVLNAMLTREGKASNIAMGVKVLSGFQTARILIYSSYARSRWLADLGTARQRRRCCSGREMAHKVPEDGVTQSQNGPIPGDRVKTLAAPEEGATAVLLQGGEASSTGVSLSQKSGCHSTGGSCSSHANTGQETSRHCDCTCNPGRRNGLGVRLPSEDQEMSRRTRGHVKVDSRPHQKIRERRRRTISRRSYSTLLVEWRSLLAARLTLSLNEHVRPVERRIGSGARASAFSTTCEL